MADFKFNLTSIALIKADFSRQLDLSLYEKDRKPEVNVKVSYSETSEGDSRGMEVSLNVSVSVINDDGEEQIKVGAEMLGDFVIIGEPPQNVVSYFGNINAPAIIFPFVREVIANLTVKASIAPIILPPMNFVAAFEESNAVKDAEAVSSQETTEKPVKPKAKRASAKAKPPTAD